MDEREIVTAQEAARELGYHINHLYRLLEQGVIKARRWNRTWMVPVSEVRRIKAMQTDKGRLPRGTAT